MSQLQMALALELEAQRCCITSAPRPSKALPIGSVHVCPTCSREWRVSGHHRTDDGQTATTWSSVEASR